MASNRFTTNTPSPFLVVSDTQVHIALAGVFDSVSIALEQEINGTTYPVRDSVGAVIVYTVATDAFFDFTKGDLIRLTPTGGLGSLAVDWNVAGTGQARP